MVFKIGTILKRYAQGRWGAIPRTAPVLNSQEGWIVFAAAHSFLFMRTQSIVRTPVQTSRKANRRRFPPSHLLIRFCSHPPD